MVNIRYKHYFPKLAWLTEAGGSEGSGKFAPACFHRASDLRLTLMQLAT